MELTTEIIQEFAQLRANYQAIYKGLPRYKNRAQAKKLCKFGSISSVNPSAKFDHQGYRVPVYTSVVYLVPAKISGFEMCPGRSKECTLACLVFSGRAIMDLVSGQKTIFRARILRTWLYQFNRPFFMDWLTDEIKAAQAIYTRPGQVYAARLNGTSDISYESIECQGFSSIMDMFPNVQFYDYTKVISRSVPSNYDITLSYTGRNIIDCLAWLKTGKNIAIVFNVKKGQALPNYWKGYKVIDGDLSDYRPGDCKGCVVGLRFKKVANKIDLVNNPFIVDPQGLDCQYIAGNDIELPF